MNVFSKVIKKASNRLNIVLSDRQLKTDITLPHTVIASDFPDSGVICLDYLSGGAKKIIYSIGIGDQINFELQLLKIMKDSDAELYAFDPTPKSLEYLGRQFLPENFHVYPYAISDKDETLEFALPAEEGWVSGSAENVKQDSRKFDFDNKIEVQGRSIESIMKELGHSKIDFLKMDIEGSEFSALEAALLVGLDIKQICVDVHPQMLQDGHKKLKSLLSAMKSNGYKIYYLDSRHRCIGCIKL
jgi:FkbM family methyltransferase